VTSLYWGEPIRLAHAGVSPSRARSAERRSFKTKTEARLAVFTWIEAWYNPRRRHTAHGRISPLNFEKMHATSYTHHRSLDTGCPPPACAWLAPRRPWTTLHRYSP